MAFSIHDPFRGLEDVLGIGDSSNRAQNEINRQFQERMSNTAYQRGRADMEKAGINPLLMAGGGNTASTPSGSSGGGSQGALKLILETIRSVANVASHQPPSVPKISKKQTKYLDSLW